MVCLTVIISNLDSHVFNMATLSFANKNMYFVFRNVKVLSKIKYKINVVGVFIINKDNLHINTPKVSS